MEPARTGTGPPEPGSEPGSEPGPEQEADQQAADSTEHSAAPSTGRARKDARAPWPPPTALVWGFGAGLLAVLVAAAVSSFWLAGLLLAGLLLLLAVLHLVLPIAALGPLAVRTPWVDATTCLVLAVGVAVLAVVAPGGLRG